MQYGEFLFANVCLTVETSHFEERVWLSSVLWDKAPSSALIKFNRNLLNAA